MFRKFSLMLFLAIIMGMTFGCSENYSNGERVGFVTKFSQKGIIWKSWEGEVNLTQTGMNTSSLFEISVDNDVNDPKVIATLDSAATYGWKVKIRYHETFGKNWFSNRGGTSYFVSEVVVLDKTPMKNMFGDGHSTGGGTGKTDTIFVVIVPKDKLK